MSSDQSIKEAVRQFWDTTPCGTRDLPFREASEEFFQRLEQERNAREPFIERFAGFSRWKGKRVLEVGIGAGTDFIRFARAGAILSGVDLTEHAVRLVTQRLRMEGLRADVRRSDGEHLPFEDNTFDFVYSWGVIHHTESPQRAADEILRVTEPGGEVCVMVYHRYSLVGLQCWLLNALLRGKPWRTFSDVIWHHIESIGTKAYTVREARAMFSCLAHLRVSPIVTPYDVRVTRTRFLPDWVRAMVPSRLGWFLVVQGMKQRAADGRTMKSPL